MCNFRIFVLTATCLAASLGVASDLDDGISIDNKIDDSLQREVNTTYIVTKAKGKARSKIKGSKTIVLKDGKAGVGNIEIGAGADLKGATIINLSTNKDSTVIAE